MKNFTGETAAVIEYVTAASDRVMQSISVRLDGGGQAYWWEADVELVKLEHWEMTLRDYLLKSGWQQLSVNLYFENVQPDRYGDTYPLSKQGGTYDSGSPLNKDAAYHKEAVKIALKADKPVPAEVLADYPDFKKKPEPDLDSLIVLFTDSIGKVVKALNDPKTVAIYQGSDAQNRKLFLDMKLKEIMVSLHRTDTAFYKEYLTNTAFKEGLNANFEQYMEQLPKPKSSEPDTPNALRGRIIRQLRKEWEEAEKRLAAGDAGRLHLTESKMNALAVELLGVGYDRQFFWEVAELAWVLYYRTRISNLFDASKSGIDIARWTWDFYKKIQPSYNYSNSTKRIFQQYSTSAPVAFLAGWFADLQAYNVEVLEPSAGNGLLTIAADANRVTANEIDPLRLENLHHTDGIKKYGYKQLTSQDGAKPFPATMHRKFDAVVTNPPFGTLPDWNYDFADFRITKLDHVMCSHALECLKDDGRAALIIGDWTNFDRTGKIDQSRTFFNYLGRYYRIVDMINIDSGALYNKQGTAFPLRMILLAGRKRQPSGGAPTLDDLPQAKGVVRTYPELIERVAAARKAADYREPDVLDMLEEAIGKMKIELNQ